MSENKTADYGLDEGDFAYPGWRVSLASGVGVLIGFASLLVYTIGIFLSPADPYADQTALPSVGHPADPYADQTALPSVGHPAGPS